MSEDEIEDEPTDDETPNFDKENVKIEIKEAKKTFEEFIDEDPERFFHMVESIQSWDERKKNEITTCPICGGWGIEGEQWLHIQTAHKEMLWNNHEELMKNRPDNQFSRPVMMPYQPRIKRWWNR